MRIANEVLLTAADMSAASITTNPVWLGHMYLYAIQAVFTGAPVGTLKIQTSCDDGGPNVTSPTITNWSDYTGSSQAISAAGNFTWRVTADGDKWVRLVYTKTSGTGSLGVTVNMKGV